MSKIVTSGDRAVGSRLRLRRKQRAVSESQLADTLGVSELELRAYEVGEARIGPERLAKAAEALGVTIAFFFLGAASPHGKDERAGQALLSPGAAELLSAYKRIASSQLRAAVLRLAIHLAGAKQVAISLTLAEAHAGKLRSDRRMH